MKALLVSLVTLSCLFAPAAVAAQDMEFRKVDVFVADRNGDEKKKDARLEIDLGADEIRLVDEKRGAARATYASLSIDQISGLAYEAEPGKRWGGVVGVTPVTHWLTIESEALPSGRITLRLDKDNQYELRSALRLVTGFVFDTGRHVVR